MNIFFKGVILGFSIAAPVGPIGILCIRKTLQYGRLSGFFSGLGAALADMCYAIIAAFGLTIISDALLANQFWLRLIGGIFLVYLGTKTFFARTMFEKKQNIHHVNLLNDFISTFFLTITNPMTILAFFAIFAGIDLKSHGRFMNDIFLVLGVLLGSAIWWFVLSEFVTLFRKKIEQKMMVWINRLAGILIISFGLVTLASIFFASKKFF
jgi:threonine/homoserine/homoserine lactone efflux protein